MTLTDLELSSTPLNYLSRRLVASVALAKAEVLREGGSISCRGVVASASCR
jgi:hypothetical protein